MSRQFAQDLAPAAVAAGTWTIVVPASTATFTVRDKLVSTVHGSLPITSGTVVTEAGGRVVRAIIELHVAGVATGNTHRDRDLHKPRFLDAAAHPTIIVEAGQTEPQDAGWTAEARLSARGASCPLTLEVTPTSVEGERVRVRVTGRLDRTGLGMRVPTFIVGRFVELDVDVLFERT